MLEATVYSAPGRLRVVQHPRDTPEAFEVES